MPEIELHELSTQKKKQENPTTITTNSVLSTPISRDSTDSLNSSFSKDSFSRDLERPSNELEGIDLTDPEEAIIKPFKADRNFKYTLIAVWVGNFLCALDGTIVSTTMSNIAADFNQSNLVSWIAVSYLLTSTAFQPLYGKTSDILGRKTLLLVAQFLFGFGILLSGISTNVQTLSLARAVSGIGGSGILSLSTIIISDVVPLTHRSMYAAYGTCISSTSQMLGGPVGGFFIATIGWRWMFLIQVPLILCCMVITMFCEIKVAHIPEGPERFSKENIKRIDFGGIILSNLVVSSIIFLLSNNGGYSTWLKNVLYITLASSLAGYVYVEKYIAVEKIIDPQLMKGQIGVLGFANGVNSLSFYLILFMTPLYLQLIQHISVTHIGFYTLFCVISSAIGAVISGTLIRKHNQTEHSTMRAGIYVSSVCFAVQVIGFAMLYLITRVVLPMNNGLLWRLALVLSLMVAGLGVGGFGPGCALFIIGKAGPEAQASAQTAVNVIKSLGNVLGISVSLSVYNKDVSKNLRAFFGEDQKDLVEKLVKDSDFIYNGLNTKYLKEVLVLYKNALSSSFEPVFFMTVIGLTVMFLLNRSVQKGLK